MFVSEKFTFDGISGDDMFELMLVQVESGLIQQQFGTSRKTVTDKVKNRSKLYYYGVEEDPLKFSLTFFKENNWTYEERIAVTRWLIQDTYKPFCSEDYPLEFDVIAISSPTFYNTGDGRGYIKMDFEANAPFGFSPTSIMEFDLSSNTTSGTIIDIFNKSNTYNWYFSEVEIEMNGDTEVHMFNLNDGNREFGFTELNDNEIVYVDNEKNRIFSDLSNTRYDNLIDHRFFRLVYGLNRIKVVGKCKIKIRCRFPMMV